MGRRVKVGGAVAGLLVGVAWFSAASCGGKVAATSEDAGADEGVDAARGGCGEGACDVGDTCRLGCYSCVCEAKLGWRCSTGDCADADSPCPPTLPVDGVVPCTGTGACEYATPCRAIAICGGGTWHTRGCRGFADGGSGG